MTATPIEHRVRLAVDALATWRHGKASDAYTLHRLMLLFGDINDMALRDLDEAMKAHRERPKDHFSF